MATPSKNYVFDQWAEFLTVTICENICRCQLGQNKVKKVRLTLSEQSNWPIKFKVILDNELIAPFPGNQALSDGSHEIDYVFQAPSQVPYGRNLSDPVAKNFIEKAKSIDSNFLSDTWSLNTANSTPSLLRQLAFRSMNSLIPKELVHNDIAITADFALQFFDGNNYVSFSYDAIKQSLSEQIQYYFTNDEIKQAAAKCCFKHSDNQNWFLSIK